jgi:hypothetical protein
MSRPGALIAACQTAIAAFRAIDRGETGDDSPDERERRRGGQVLILAPLTMVAALLFVWTGLCGM